MTDLYAHPDWLAFTRAMLAAPGDSLPALIAADWLRDHGETEERAGETVVPPAFSQFLPIDYCGRGSGSGSGRGSGSGIGRGRGSGIGRGRGIGIGIGRGIGRGSGIGRGIGMGRETIMEIGKCYLLETVDWFAWVGRVKRQVGPWEYEFESYSKISDTNNGDNWHLLAAGDATARRAATYIHYTTPGIFGMGVVVKIEWVGGTPQEEGL